MLATIAVSVTIVALAGPGSPIANSVLRWWRERRDRTAVDRHWVQLISRGHTLGHPRRKLVIEFADYECPYCRSADVVVSGWLSSRPDAGVVLVNYPLPIHAQADAAARASDCAAAQGRFAQMHHELMSASQWLADTSWLRVALLTGVRDTAAFRICLTDSLTTAGVEAARRLGEIVDVRSTPTFISKRGRIVGVPSFRGLDRLAVGQDD